MLILPHLEYCTTLLSPQYHIYINSIERVQNKFLKSAAFKYGLLYIENPRLLMQARLGLDNLHRRRIIAGLTMLFKK